MSSYLPAGVVIGRLALGCNTAARRVAAAQNGVLRSVTMAHGLADASQPLALELFGLLRDLDPARWRDSREQPVRQRISALTTSLEKILADHHAGVPVAERWQAIAQLLREKVPHPDIGDAERWTTFRKLLQVEYERLSASLRESSVRVPSLRPTNYVRNVWHMSASLGAIYLVEGVLDPRTLWVTPLAVAALFWSLEALRAKSDRARELILKVLHPIAHPHEGHRINSATYFATALTIIAILFEPVVCSVAIAVLGAGDPAAAVIGRRFGKTKLVAQRTVEGSLAFVVVGGLGALGVLRICHPEITLIAAIAMAACATVPAAIMELLSNRIDDNLSIPLAAASGAWLATVVM